MPLLYDDGQNAFRRLQEEIIRFSPDQTLFAWKFAVNADSSSAELVAASDATHDSYAVSMIASLPAAFDAPGQRVGSCILDDKFRLVDSLIIC